MDSQPSAPGEGRRDPLVADQPLPPGSNAEEIVDELDARIRRGGPDEVEEADAEADAAQGQGADGSEQSGQDPDDD